MKILATSDLHGQLPIITEPFDLLLICGDICPLKDQYYAAQDGWVKYQLPYWINDLPYKDEFSKVILIFGNHDFFGERATKDDFLEVEKNCNGRLKILRHEPYNYYGVEIFGTPYCSLFGNWAFMVNDDTLEKKFSQIPEGIDILISHDSPTTNKLGAILEGRWKNEDTGNKILAKHIERIKPKVFLSGHMHSGNHKFEKINDTWMANVSRVNERYEAVNPILSFELDEYTKEIIYPV